VIARCLTPPGVTGFFRRKIFHQIHPISSHGPTNKTPVMIQYIDQLKPAAAFASAARIVVPLRCSYEIIASLLVSVSSIRGRSSESFACNPFHAAMYVSCVKSSARCRFRTIITRWAYTSRDVPRTSSSKDR